MKILVFISFCILSIVLTYPLILNMDRALSDPGDPLLNTWILAYNVVLMLPFDVGGFHFRAHRLTNPVMITVFLFIIRYFSRRKEPFFLRRFIRNRVVAENQRFYLLLLIFTFILSLGLAFFLYSVFYKVFPPVRSLRVAARWGVMVTFAISVLAGFGIGNLLKAGSLQRIKAICVLIPLLLIAEYACFPLRLYLFPRGVPEIYRWLSRQKGDFAVLELPMASSIPTVYMETSYM